MTIVEYQFPGWESMEGLDYRVFPASLESDPLVFFHGTLTANFDKILADGFKCALQLKGVGLESVSYACDSSLVLSHIGNRNARDEIIIIAVRFGDVEARTGMAIESGNVYVYDGTQPEIIGFCKIPARYPPIVSDASIYPIGHH